MTVFTTRISKLLATAAATAVFGLAPSFASAHDHDNYHHDDHRDVHVDIEINHAEPVYEERVTRVWVEPVVRSVSDRRWVEPETRLVTDRVWRDAVVEDRIVATYVPAHWEMRDVCDDGRHVRREKIYVNGHEERQHQQVVVCPAHWEDVQRQEVVCPGHWENCDRQEVVCPGHWEDRTERVVIDHHRDGLDVIAGFIGHIGH